MGVPRYVVAVGRKKEREELLSQAVLDEKCACRDLGHCWLISLRISLKIVKHVRRDGHGIFGVSLKTWNYEIIVELPARRALNCLPSIFIHAIARGTFFGQKA